ncbi:MAG TPA: hypothetical protein VE826_12765, partial [Dongiaceae bacterium]|nr:hypothetical protein [Dongiaceae bacterium]
DNEECTPAAAKVAQPVMDAIGKIAAAAERAKTNGRYPATIPGGTETVSGTALAYVSYEDGARYAVTADAPVRSSAAFINCARLGFGGDPEDQAKFHLYAPQVQARGTFFIAYAPNVGLYMVPPKQAAAGATKVTASVGPEPATPPTDPFKMRAAPDCPTSSKPVADALVVAIKAARDAQRAGKPVPPSEVAEIAARGDAQHGWLEITPHEGLAQVAVLQCLNVAGIVPARLKAVGIEDTRRSGALGFADRFGFYLIARPGDAPRP